MVPYSHPVRAERRLGRLVRREPRAELVAAFWALALLVGLVYGGLVTVGVWTISVVGSMP